MTSKFTVTASPQKGVKVQVVAQHYDDQGKVTSEQITDVPDGETMDFKFYPGVQMSAREVFIEQEEPEPEKEDAEGGDG